MMSPTTNPKQQKFFFEINWKTCRIHKGFEQFSSLIGQVMEFKKLQILVQKGV